MKKWVYYIAVFLGLITLLPGLPGQGSNNPFDIQAAPDVADEVEGVPVLGNPFDIRTPPLERPVQMEPRAGSRPVEEIAPEALQSGRFRFVLVLIILGLLTLCVSLFRSIIIKSYRSLLNDNFLNQVHREQGRITSWPYLVLYLLFLFQLGAFVYLSGLQRGWFPDADHWSTLWMVVGGVAGLIFLKHLVLFLMGAVYPLGKESGQYSFTIIIFGIIIGLVLIPFNLLLAYGPENLRTALFFGGVAVLLAFYLYRSLRGLFIGTGLISTHLFHFLLYICTVEIAPVLWLVKIIDGQMG
jgi:hypothetical protein